MFIWYVVFTGLFSNLFLEEHFRPREILFVEVPARDNTGCIHSIYSIPDIHKSNIHTAVL